MAELTPYNPKPEKVQISSEYVQIDENTFKQWLKGKVSKEYEEYCEIKNDSSIIVKGKFEISKLVFECGEKYFKEIIFDGGRFKDIEFKGGYFKKIIFRRGIFDGFISLRGGNFKDIVILGGNFNHWFGTLDGSNNLQKHSDLACEKLVIERLQIENANFANNIWIEGGTIKRLEIRPVSLAKIHIKPNDDKVIVNGNIQNKYNSKPEIGSIVLSRYLFKDSILHISDVNIKNVEFDTFTNNGTITLSSLNITEKLSFKNSDLGKTTFINCSLEKNIFEFTSSKITDVSLNGTVLPTNITLPVPLGSENASINGLDQIFQKRLALSQIKKSYENRGDIVEANRYFAEEMNTLLSQLKQNGGQKSEYYTLVLNKFSSNHGQSWFRALIFTLLSSTLFFILYIISLIYTFDCSLIFDLKGYQFIKTPISDYFKYYFEFLNPTHRFNFITDDINLTSSFWDFSGRTFSGYGIYQLIAAFRKHGKKA